MSIPDGLHYQIELFKAQGVVTLHDRGSFAEPSWVSIYFGLGTFPRHHDPMANLIDDAAMRRELQRRAGWWRARAVAAQTQRLRQPILPGDQFD